MLGDCKDKWLAARLDDLDHGDIDGIEAAVRACPLEGVKKSKTEKELGYFLSNAPRMRCHWFRLRGLFVGSGIVEASCKTVVGQTASLTSVENRFTQRLTRRRGSFQSQALAARTEVRASRQEEHLEALYQHPGAVEACANRPLCFLRDERGALQSYPGHRSETHHRHAVLGGEIHQANGTRVKERHLLQTK